MTTTIENQQATLQPVHVLERSLKQLITSISAEKIFGAPIQQGETMVIPCSQVTMGMGLGGGTGSAPAKPGEEAANSEGMGGGGGGRGRPVAIIIISPEGVRVKPIVDRTAVVLAALTSAGLMTLWVTRLLRRFAPLAATHVAKTRHSPRT